MFRCAIVLAFLLPLTALAEGKKYAILVGIKKYDHSKLDALDFTENDVTELADLLKPAGFDVTLLTDATGEKDKSLEPTKSNIDKALKTVLDKCKRDDLVLIAFAGHGLQFEGKPEAYFCPKDARPLPDRADSLISLDTIYKQLDDSGAGVKLLLVDACRNDPQGGRGRGIEGDKAKAPPKGVFALFSCSAGERAFEHKDLKHGVFFHHVLEGLKGKAADRGDNVTFESLALYVRNEVPRHVPLLLKDAKQTPTMRVVEASGASPMLVRVQDARIVQEFKELEEHWTRGGSNKDFLEERALKRITAWRQAATSGSAHAMVLFGSCCLHGIAIEKDEKESYRWYRRAADLKLPCAAVSVGVLYETGQGVEKSESEAVRWYRRGADLGNSQAMVRLGWCHDLGIGVEKDSKEAVRWYGKGVEMGNSEAMWRLGFHYQIGKGVTPDEAEAVRLYRLGADKGNSEAKRLLKGLGY